MKLTRLVHATAVLVLGLGLVPACESDAVPTVVKPPTVSEKDRYKPALLLELPVTCNTPDGMRLNPATGDVILSCPNFADSSYPGVLLKVTKDNKVETFFTMPAHPDTGKAGPMGLDFGPDGNLYVADHQYRYDKEFKSRLIRVKVENGVATGSEVVATGFKLANAVMWRKNQIFVSDTWFDLVDQPGTSGIYRFTLDELNTGTPVALLPPPMAEPHLVTTFHTMAGRGINLAGADGITFDKDGNLFTGNFGDGVISKLVLDDMGNMTKQEVFMLNPSLRCVDGMFADTKNDKIYIADAKENAIRVVTGAGVLSTLWSNANSTGAMGELDQPAEVLVRGDQLIIANFDLPPATGGMLNTESDAPHTISVISLK
jgi:sugar lactone lactonase YvrE